MKFNRRGFLKKGLKKGLFVAGSVAAGGVALQKLRLLSSTQAQDPPATKVLTTDGRLVEMGSGQCGACPPTTQGSAYVHHHARSNAEVRQGFAGRRWVMVIDLAKCDGCAKCTEACGKMHFIPPSRRWIAVLVLRDSSTEAPYYLPRPCFHCDNPPCTKVCPVDATFKTQDGTVLIDNDRCIGCRFCIAACPYGVRCFNWGPPSDPAGATEQPYSPDWGFPRKVGTVEKCDFCPEMAAQGTLPACASGCPMGAIYYGDQNEDAVTNSAGDTQRLSKFLRDRAGYRQLEELGTQPRCYYLPPVNRLYPAPDEEKKEGKKA